MAINYRSHFAYRIDAWDADGENVIEHLAGVEDLQVAKATYLAACQRWPGTPITLRQGTRVIEDSRQTPITGIAACCARALSGHAAAPPPSSVMNSRRFTFAVIRLSRRRVAAKTKAPQCQVSLRS